MPLDAIPSVCVGAILLIIAGGLAIREWMVWKAGPCQLPENDENRLFAQRRLRRRIRVSLLMALIGVMIPFGDIWSVYRKSPHLWVIHWLSVLALVVMLVLIALGDLAATLSINKHAREELQRERESLEAELRQLRQQGNGHSGDPTNLG